jgi:hypothetical protein
VQRAYTGASDTALPFYLRCPLPAPIGFLREQIHTAKKTPKGPQPYATASSDFFYIFVSALKVAMMSGEAWLYLLAVLINAVNLFLQVFFTIMYSDLEWCVAIIYMPTRRRFKLGIIAKVSCRHIACTDC